MNRRTIAELANVSEATVSNALTGNRPVAPATRKRVREIAERLGYHPQASARALVTGRSEMIGLISPGGYQRQSDFQAGLIGGVVDALEARGYRTAIFHTEPTETVVPPAVLQRAVDGVVMILRWTPAFLEELGRHGIPAAIALPLAEPPEDCDWITSDYVQGAREATRHLIELGHREIAYVPTVGHGAQRPCRLRWQGYVEEVSQARLPVHPGGDRPQRVAERIAQLYSQDTPPTGLVCMASLIALQVIGESRLRGLHVPRDVSVVGFDDTSYATFMKPGMTVMDVRFVDIAARAAQMVLERIEEPGLAPRHELFEERLIVRGTTAPLRGHSRSQ